MKFLIFLIVEVIIILVIKISGTLVNAYVNEMQLKDYANNKRTVDTLKTILSIINIGVSLGIIVFDKLFLPRIIQKIILIEHCRSKTQ